MKSRIKLSFYIFLLVCFPKIIFPEPGAQGWVLTGKTGTLAYSIMEDIYNPLIDEIGFSATVGEDYNMLTPYINIYSTNKKMVYFPKEITEVIESQGVVCIEVIFYDELNGYNSSYIEIEIIDDDNFELPEYIFIVIEGDKNGSYILGDQYTHIVKIIDDDNPVEGVWCVTAHLNALQNDNGTTKPLALSLVYKIFFYLENIGKGEYYGEVVKARAYESHVPIMDQAGKNMLTPKYFSPSPVIPPGTEIHGKTGTDSSITLTFNTGIDPDPQILPIYSNRINPFPISLSRSVTLTFPRVENISDITEGKIMETTRGFLSGENPQTLEGFALLTYYGETGKNIEMASPEQKYYVNRQITPDKDYILFQKDKILEIPSKNRLFIHSDYQNLQPSSGNLSIPATFLGGGGIVIDENIGESGANPGTCFSFGQPFAGIAYFPDIIKNLGDIANSKLNTSTPFYLNKNITKGNENLDLGPGLDFDEETLVEAERLYVSMIHANPFDEKGVKGLMEARIRRPAAYNILTDRKMLEAFNKKFEQSSYNKSGENILIEEIGILEQASDYALISTDLLFELLADKQYRGIGTYLRGEIPADSQNLSDKTTETLLIMTESIRRYAEVELNLARKNLLLEFMDPYYRDIALNQLMDLEIYLTEALRALCSISEQCHYSDNGLGILKGLLEKTHAFESEIQQGHNAFGFLNEFVPFLIPSNQQTNHADNVNRAIEFAKILLDDACSYQTLAQENLNTFNNDDKEYREKATALSISYKNRLKSLCGIIENSLVSDPDDRFEPDIFTYAVEDVSERQLLISKLPGSRKLKSYGEIAIQYQNIQNSDDRVEQAINEMDNLIKEMGIHQEAGNKLAEGRKNLAELVLANGEKIALLTRQKGILQREALIKQARLQKRSRNQGIFKSIANYIINGFQATNPLQIIPIIFDTGFNILSTIEHYRTIQEGANIQGDLAVALADIDATIVEIKAMEQAEVHFQEMRDQLIRTEEQLKVLALRMANLQLEIRIAERDQIQQEIRLANMFAEVDSLLADYARQLRLADEHYNLAWNRPDHRAAMINYQYDAEESFFRAQGGTYIAVRALEYYLNECLPVSDIYEMLYSSRRVENLQSVLNEVQARLAEAPIFVDVTCPGNNILSLKYDLLSTTDFELCATGTGEACNIYNEDMFTYYDKYHKRLLKGRKAYNAAFRDFLIEHLNPTSDTNTLEFSFSTDILPRRDISLPPGVTEPYEIRNNPLFYSHKATGQVILGFEPPNCKDPSQPPYQGISINFTSPYNTIRKKIYVIELSQAGNMTLRSSSPEKVYNPDDPTEGLIVYSTYQQKFPRSLRPTDPSDYMEIGSLRIGILSPRINNDIVGTPNLTLAFTDRSVANDQWVFKMHRIDMDNRKFLDDLDMALEEAIIDPNVDFNFISDIQFRLGWSAKVLQYE